MNEIPENETPIERIDVSLEDVEDVVSVIGSVLPTINVNEKPLISETGKKTLKWTRGSVKIAKSAAGAGAAVVSASGLAVAATSGAGITSGLAAAGGIVGGGMAAGPGVLAAGPAYLAVQGINGTAFKDSDDLNVVEKSARRKARLATNVGALTGVAGTGVAVVSGGASGAAIMSTLASIGGVVGGGAIAGTAVVVAAPIAVAAVAGFGIYKMVGGKRIKKDAV